jgi:RNA ligase
MKFYMNKVKELLDKGLVREKKHSVLPIALYNYGEITQFTGQWCDYTKALRGTVLDIEGNVITKGFNKIFNHSEPQGKDVLDELQKEDYSVYDKVDGSLIIVTRTDEYGLLVHTRGSFESEQALIASDFLKNKYEDVVFPKGYSFLFEIVYPENKIVLNYGDKEELILLNAVDLSNGLYIGLSEAKELLEWKYDCAEELSIKDIYMNRENREGVILVNSHHAVKVKQEDYIEMHRIRSHFSKKMIMKQLMEGTPFLELCELYPDEFHETINVWGNEFFSTYELLKDKIEITFNKYKNIETKKEFVLSVLNSNYKPFTHILFDLYDKKCVEAKLRTLTYNTIMEGNSDE